MIRKVIKNEYWKQALQDFYPIYMKLHRFMCPQPFQGIRELIIQLRQNNLIVALSQAKEQRVVRLHYSNWGWILISTES